MNYRDYAKENVTLPTTIQTRINNNLRISSCYRRFANPHFETWAWETFLWEGDWIEKEYDTLQNAEQVVELHTSILKEHI